MNFIGPPPPVVDFAGRIAGAAVGDNSAVGNMPVRHVSSDRDFTLLLVTRGRVLEP
jgi:hypothetical protein